MKKFKLSLTFFRDSHNFQTLHFLKLVFIAPENIESIRQAMEDFTTYTCIKFQPRKGENDYIQITGNRNNGCSAEVGRVHGPQSLNLANEGCAIKAIAIHELMHALGFDHEQNRKDRNSFVTIYKENVDPGT